MATFDAVFVGLTILDIAGAGGGDPAARRRRLY